MFANNYHDPATCAGNTGVPREHEVDGKAGKTAEGGIRMPQFEIRKFLRLRDRTGWFDRLLQTRSGASHCQGRQNERSSRQTAGNPAMGG